MKEFLASPPTRSLTIPDRPWDQIAYARQSCGKYGRPSPQPAWLTSTYTTPEYFRSTWIVATYTVYGGIF